MQSKLLKKEKINSINKEDLKEMGKILDDNLNFEKEKNIDDDLIR